MEVNFDKHKVKRQKCFAINGEEVFIPSLVLTAIITMITNANDGLCTGFVDCRETTTALTSYVLFS